MTTQRVRVQISTRKIKENYLHLQSLVPKDCKVLAVVKADAYGHGAAEVCNMLYQTGCRYFAVACIEEALHLRENGIGGNILILGNTDPSYVKQLQEFDLIQTVDSEEYALQLSAFGTVRVHVKVDTGMSRLGLYCHRETDIDATASAVSAIASLPGISVEGIFTHFADSDGVTEDFTRKQFGLFSDLLKKLEEMGVDVGIRHCCNSAGILRFPEMHLDMVRAGLVLYGLMPSPYVRDEALRPAMTLIARVSAVNTLLPGDAVSYGGVYRAEKPMRVAVLSIGYADGLSRVLSGNLSVNIGGREVKLIGRICMDLCMADLGNVPCEPGDEAVIFDSPEKIEEMAAKMGTINYEVICSLKKRVAIEYV
ncbi:MAG: alanine racemase [Clostridia bacterium]|jgi:alanine racemase|nr:alanine racemase [Clostridia bacterium]MBO7157042.1 alanine racemase [Clostridia bacterium]